MDPAPKKALITTPTGERERGKLITLANIEKENERRVAEEKRKIKEARAKSQVDAWIREEERRIQVEKFQAVKRGEGTSSTAAEEELRSKKKHEKRKLVTTSPIQKGGGKKSKGNVPELRDESEEGEDIPTDVEEDARLIDELEEDVPSKKKIACSEVEWKRSFEDRGVTCERDINRNSLFFNKAFKALRSKRFTFYENNTLKGYVYAYCKDFYMNMQINEEESEIHSKVKGKKIVITPERIATYLSYERPELGTFQYPSLSEETNYTFEELASVMLMNPKANKGSKMALGGLHTDYQFLNKILHHNLFPRGSEYLIGLLEADFLYAFMREDIEFDIALWILVELRNFRFARLSMNMPYVAMISHMVWEDLKKPKVEFTAGVPGTISHTTLKAIESKSMAPSDDHPLGWKPKAGAAKTRNDEWMNAIFTKVCLEQELNKERDELSKERDMKMNYILEQNRDMGNKVDYMLQVIEEMNNVKYCKEWRKGDRILPLPRERVPSPPLQQQHSDHNEDEDEDEETETEDREQESGSDEE